MTFEKVLNFLFFFYGVSLSLSYVILALFSARALNFYLRKNKFISYEALLSSPNAPSVSLIAPAYNEEKTIVENIRSLLSLHYNNIEVIIVNDGSKDNSLQTMIDAYQLEKVNFAVNQQIPGKPIRGIYKAKNPAYSKLIVVDKENGGKADALNAGINISGNDLITCIDVDCIIEQDSILKMVKPFIEEETKVIACGGVVRIANSCEIEDGRLIKVHVPTNMVARFQVIEYLRAFLMGRMAWAKVNGLLLISGAMGMFDKRIAIACGGYDHNTVGEDMELVVRMRRYMAERNLKAKVTYVPDPLCWTEAPSDYKVLARQRSRWMRGTMETLWTHRTILLNPRYGVLGLVSYPYWLIYEWLAPIVEFLGLVYFAYLVATGFNTWHIFVFLLMAVYAFAVCMSFLAFFYEEYTYQQYTSKRDILRLMGAAMLEPFIFHPRSAWWGFKGNIDKIRGVKSWGEMTRAGFKKPADTVKK